MIYFIHDILHDIHRPLGKYIIKMYNYWIKLSTNRLHIAVISTSGHQQSATLIMRNNVSLLTGSASCVVAAESNWRWFSASFQAVVSAWQRGQQVLFSFFAK